MLHSPSKILFIHIFKIIQFQIFVQNRALFSRTAKFVQSKMIILVVCSCFGAKSRSNMVLVCRHVDYQLFFYMISCHRPFAFMCVVGWTLQQLSPPQS